MEIILPLQDEITNVVEDVIEIVWKNENEDTISADKRILKRILLDEIRHVFKKRMKLIDEKEKAQQMQSNTKQVQVQADTLPVTQSVTKTVTSSTDTVTSQSPAFQVYREQENESILTNDKDNNNTQKDDANNHSNNIIHHNNNNNNLCKINTCHYGFNNTNDNTFFTQGNRICTFCNELMVLDRYPDKNIYWYCKNGCLNNSGRENRIFLNNSKRPRSKWFWKNHFIPKIDINDQPFQRWVVEWVGP